MMDVTRRNDFQDSKFTGYDETSSTKYNVIRYPMKEGKEVTYFTTKVKPNWLKYTRGSPEEKYTIVIRKNQKKNFFQLKSLSPVKPVCVKLTYW